MRTTPKLREFTKVRKGEKFVSLHVKYASRLSTELAYELEVENNDKLHFLQDELNKKDWYISTSKNTETGSTIKKREGRHGYVFFNTSMAKQIAEQFELKKDLIKIKVGSKITIDDKDYYPLITAQLF